MSTNILVLVAVTVTMLALGMPRVARSIDWRATITPLASIIGSGFLVLGPILHHAYGDYAPLVMAGLCLAAYLFGAAIRENISSLAAGTPRLAIVLRFEKVASWALAVAYIISVAYYLNLFGAFAVSLIPGASTQSATFVTTAMLVIIAVIGWTRGFGALERLEQISVTLKLSIIAGLLMGMFVYFGETASTGGLVLTRSTLSLWQSTTLAFGLIVTVQGFETSRYLSDQYDAATRIRTMRRAQLISSAIYMVYIFLFAYVFAPGDMALSETAIIDLMGLIAPILPVLLVVAALSAQFSAAIADTGGCGGLVEELTDHRVVQKQAYIVLTVIGIALTWWADIFEIISYASRAFAFYYALQAGIAAFETWHLRQGYRKPLLFGILTLLGLAVTLFGTAIEA
ncbi:MAG: hypothetical protein L3J02_05050 [Henriciella sp.]|nr:hypothetical protein [Henriciella sp.]